MTVFDLVQSALRKNKEAFGNIHEHRAEKIVMAVLADLDEQIKSIEEGEVEIGGFGKFIIRKAKTKKEGQKSNQRRVLFRTSHYGKNPQ